MAKYQSYDRLYVATLTPYKPGTFDLDEEALRKHLRYFMQPKFVDAGGAVIINPEAGEVFYLTREEKRRTIQIALEECGGKVPVFSGVIAPTTAETVAHARDAKELGVDGIFLIPPMGAGDVTTCWNTAKYPEVMLNMAKEIIDAVDLPAIVHPTGPYVVPYGGGLPASTVVKMCTEIPQIVGWKMTYAYDGWRIVARALRQLPRHVGVYGAPAVFFHENLANNYFDGTVSGSFAYAMEAMIDHIQAWRTGDVKKACEIWQGGLAELQEYVYDDFSRLHIRYKAAAWLRGTVPAPFMRPPVPGPRIAEIRRLKELLTAVGLEIIGDDEIERVVATLPAELG